MLMAVDHFMKANGARFWEAEDVGKDNRLKPPKPRQIETATHLYYEEPEDEEGE